MVRKGENITDIIKSLLDPNDNSDVVLYNKENEEFVFTQIANIELDKKLYAILKLKEEYPGLENMAFAFEIDLDNQDLIFIEDNALIDLIFDKYHKLAK